MQFTGKNLVLVRDCIDGAISDLRGQIGSCPDVFHFREQISALEEQIDEMDKLMARVDRAILKEEQDAKRS